VSVLVVAEHDNQSVKSATLNTSRPRRGSGASSSSSSPARAAARQEGGRRDRRVKKVLVADAPHYKDPLAETLRRWSWVFPEPTRILLPANFLRQESRAALAALLDVAQISDIVSVVSADTFVRPIYAGNALATVQSKDKIKIITVRTTGSTLFPQTALGRGRT